MSIPYYAYPWILCTIKTSLPDTETGVDNTPVPSLLVPETCTKISVESEQDEDGSWSLCSQVLFTHVAAGTVADTHAGSTSGRVSVGDGVWWGWTIYDARDIIMQAVRMCECERLHVRLSTIIIIIIIIAVVHVGAHDCVID